MVTSARGNATTGHTAKIAEKLRYRADVRSGMLTRFLDIGPIILTSVLSGFRGVKSVCNLMRLFHVWYIFGQNSNTRAEDARGLEFGLT